MLIISRTDRSVTMWYALPALAAFESPLLGADRRRSLSQLTSPMVLGHESAGIVAQGLSCFYVCALFSTADLRPTTVGSNVTSLSPGDRVAMEPGESCRMCHSCKDGHYNASFVFTLPFSGADKHLLPQRCKDMQFAATPPFDGTLAGYYKLPADMCYLLSDSVSLEEGALIEPLAVGVMAVTTIGQMALGANVVGQFFPYSWGSFLTLRSLQRPFLQYLELDQLAYLPWPPPKLSALVTFLLSTFRSRASSLLSSTLLQTISFPLKWSKARRD